MSSASTVLQSRLSMKGSAVKPVYAGCTATLATSYPHTACITHNCETFHESTSNVPLKVITQQLRPTSWPAPSISMHSLSSPIGESRSSPAMMENARKAATVLAVVHVEGVSKDRCTANHATTRHDIAGHLDDAAQRQDGAGALPCVCPPIRGA